MNNEHYRELLRINRRFGTLLSSGVPIVQSMALIAEDTLPAYAEAFVEMRQAIREGATLGKSMERWPALFPAVYRNLVKESECTGSLDVIVQFAAEMFAPAIMSGRMNREEDWHGLEEPMALISFTRQYSELLSTGVIWWGRCLFILEHEALPPFDEIARQLQTQTSTQRWEPLSERMGKLPMVFSPFYRAMVQTGDSQQGNHSEAVRHLLELLQEDWRISQYVGWQDGRPSLIIGQGRPAKAEWTALSRQEQMITLVLFCRAIGMLLSSGVSLSVALSTVSHLLPKAEQDAVLAATQLPEQDATKALLEMDFLPGFIKALLHAGLWDMVHRGGTLEFTMTRAADALNAEIMAG